MAVRLTLLALFLVALFPVALPHPAMADVHVLAISEYYVQCDDGSTDIQYIEIESLSSGQFFRQCATLQVKRTVAGGDVFLADPVFAGRADNQSFDAGKTWLIATPAFQAKTGIVPNILMPNGTLDPAGGVIRFAADSGCPIVNWGTIHEVRYGDQGADPIPGPHQAANWSESKHNYSLGTPTPQNLTGSTTSTWTCAVVPILERTWGRIKATFGD